MSEVTWEKLSQVAVKGAQYDSRERQPHPKCLEGTRIVLLSHIYELLDNNARSRIIWLHGTAGVGKSAVAFTVAERMRGLKVTEGSKEKRLAGTFFFSRKHTKRRTTGYFFATLAYQLASNFPSVRADVNRAILENPALLDHDMSLRDQMEGLFLRPLRRLQLRLRECPPLTFVIDALDECTSESLEECPSESELADLISLLGEALCEPGLPVTHILLTGRSEEHIRKAMQKDEIRPLVCEIPVRTSGQGVATTISLDGADVDNDIYIFLQHSFTELQSRHPSFPQPSTDQLARLASRAGRRFIVASTMVKFIDDRHSDPGDRLQLMLELTSELLPGTEVYKLYDRILSTCADPTLAYLHLSVVAALADPLPMSHISELLGPGQGRDVETVLVQLRSVIDIPTDSSRPVHISHSSVRDYVSHRSNCSLHQVQYITSPHSLLALSSLHLMVHNIPQSMVLLDTLSELTRHSQAMEPQDPQSLKHSLSFTVQPPEPLQVLITMLWLRGDRSPKLQFWLETLDGRAWLQTEGGEDWLMTQGGKNWLSTNEGEAWLQTQNEKGWLQTWGGREWLDPQSGRKWLQTTGGQDWLQTTGGQDWLQTPGGRDWLQAEGGKDWLQAQRGLDWLQTSGGRNWVQTRGGEDWLQTEGGKNWLWTNGGEAFLQTRNGKDWLRTQGGRDWLLTPRGQGWIQKRAGRDWLETQGGRDWLETLEMRAWLQTQDWLQTKCGQEHKQLLTFDALRPTLDGTRPYSPPSPPSHQPYELPFHEPSPLSHEPSPLSREPSPPPYLQPLPNRVGLLTLRESGWLHNTGLLQTPRGIQWLQTRGGREWLEYQGGYDWLMNSHGQEWLQSSFGREWLLTSGGQEWLPTSGGREWLQTSGGRKWLQTDGGRDWLQKPHGQAWRLTTVWVTMEEFSTTLEAIGEYSVAPGLPLHQAFEAIRQFKSLPDFLMFPAFLALRHQDSTSPLIRARFPRDMEIIHAMLAFSSFACRARAQSESASDTLNYACQNWAVHLSRAADPWDERLAHVFKSFWTRNLLSWLERQWCLKDLQSCFAILCDGQKLASKHFLEVSGSSQSRA